MVDIYARHASQGLTAGSLADQERERLIEKLGLCRLVADTFTLADLYEVAGEALAGVAKDAGTSR